MQLVGRHSSLYTRMPLMFADELAVPLEFVPVPDMTRTDVASYAGNPALKLPILKLQGAELYGALNICRAIAAAGSAEVSPLFDSPYMAGVLAKTKESKEYAFYASR